jgi:hypothetical protein
MLLAVIVGIIFSAAGATLFAYPLFSPEEIRSGSVVRPGSDLLSALQKTGKPLMLNNRKLFYTGSALIALGAVLLSVGAIY